MERYTYQVYFLTSVRWETALKSIKLQKVTIRSLVGEVGAV